MYKRSTIAIVSIFLSLLLATMFVCIDEPYSKMFWIEVTMLLVSGAAFGTVSYRMYSHSDSTIPISIVGTKITFSYLCFVVSLSLPVFFDLTLKAKYYILMHSFGIGIWAIIMLVLRMARHAIDGGDERRLA